MFETNHKLTLSDSSSVRAEELFQQQRQEAFRNTDQLFGRLMLFQWIAAILFAIYVSPRTWAGESNQIHPHVWAAIFFGGAISIFPIWLTRVWRGPAFSPPPGGGGPNVVLGF